MQMCRSFCFLLCVCVSHHHPPKKPTDCSSLGAKAKHRGREKDSVREREQERQRESLGVCFSEGWMILLGLLLGI